MITTQTATFAKLENVDIGVESLDYFDFKGR